ncbi:glycosyltransferase family protein [Winogradskyella vincentii]|uniref:Glycosyltransferase n=1 Tax=Winogradskyella vincentii TaxID=2877122 RepID=A0ABS7XXW3_9FLAO|nr:glycosyltransferase [Winogradskyella vincentii]MCA0151874.1 glycosyltransferase [Winogradskyella vincentii]
MKSVLIVSKRQYGYHTDSYELAKFLAREFDVHYFCFDAYQERIEGNGVNVIYVSSKGHYLIKALRFIRYAIKEVKKDYSFRFMVYFSFCSLVRLFSRKRVVLDIRTGSIQESKIQRKVDNWFRGFESIFFNRVTIISKGLREKLNIPVKKTYILPLGANSISKVIKKFDYPRLFYIGTFYNRNIQDTIIGLSIFLKKFNHLKIDVSYDIVGSGSGSEILELKKLVKRLNLEKNVVLHGRLNHNQARQFFDVCNVGISYVPLTTYFNHQPPTKTFEYILSGIACLATKTHENERLIGKINGILHEDSPEGFALGLEEIYSSFANYDSKVIANSLPEYNWESIFKRFRTEFMG